MKQLDIINILKAILIIILILFIWGCSFPPADEMIVDPQLGQIHGRLIAEEYSGAFNTFLVAEDRNEIYYINCTDGCETHQIFALNYLTGGTRSIYSDPNENEYIKLIQYEAQTSTLFFSKNSMPGPAIHLHLLDLNSLETREFKTDFEIVENGHLIKNDLLILKANIHPHHISYDIYKSDIQGNAELLNIEGDPLYIFKNSPRIIVRDSTHTFYSVFDYEINSILAIDSINEYHHRFFEMDNNLYNLYQDWYASLIEINQFSTGQNFLRLNVSNSEVLDLNPNSRKLVFVKGQEVRSGAFYILEDTVRLKVVDMDTQESLDVSKITSEVYLGAFFLDDVDSLIYNTRHGFYMVGYN